MCIGRKNFFTFVAVSFYDNSHIPCPLLAKGLLKSHLRQYVVFVEVILE